MYILSNLTLIVSQNIIFIFSRRKQKREQQEKEEEYKNSLLCRFVVDGLGKKVGESVAINHDLLIIKSKDKYLGVPLKHIQEEEKTLLVKGLIDNSKAESLGENWREQNFKEISHNINVE
jgi:hypothetical protein